MQICPNPDCKNHLGGKIEVCPDCGTALHRPERVGGYEIIECVADSRTATIYRARSSETQKMVCLRLYDADVTISPDQKKTLHKRFADLRELPADRFVHTLEFARDDATARWYRVTPWLPDVKAWGDLKSEALYRNSERKREWLDICRDLAESFDELHRIGRVIPDFTLDDCLLYRTAEGRLRVRLDATLASCLGPGSGRGKIRDRHPDFAPERALSAQSDVWTLGSIVVAMLKGSSDITDYAGAMDEINAERRPIAIHPKLGRLLRQMVDPDPAERPRDMKSVCERLSEFGPREIGEWNILDNQHRVLLRRIGWMAAATAAAVVGLTAIQMHRQSRQLDERIEDVRQEATGLIREGQGYVDARTADTVRGVLDQIRRADSEHRVQAVLDRYARSVAFVLTETWIETGDQRQTIGELSGIGSAFLVTSDGYMLSNRHVVAPWTTTRGMSVLNTRMEELRREGRPYRFGVAHYLWFDGDEAFRHRHITTGDKIEDRYRLDTAYSSESGRKRVELVGIMPKPADPAEFFASTLEDDVAVLKISVLPDGAIPIPLRAAELPRRGAGVLAIGYSRGRAAIPGTRAVARCSRGVVTALPGDVITMDADIHQGNSGGPVLDLDGYAIGIASAVFALERIDPETGALETVVPAQTAMGQIEPIETARGFLDRVRDGAPVWSGLPAGAFEPEFRAARRAADRGDWQRAGRLATVPGVRGIPDLALPAAIFSLTSEGFSPEGRLALESAAAINPDLVLPALLRYWDAWWRGIPKAERPGRDVFLRAAWHSPFEPFGQVVRMLEGNIDFKEAIAVAESSREMALLLWGAGAVAARKGENEQAAYLLQQAVTRAGPIDQDLLDLMTATLWRTCRQRPLSHDDEDEIITLAMLKDAAYGATASEQWRIAIRAADRYLALPHRPESANSLGVGLLRAQLSGLTGNRTSEKRALEAFRERIDNPWYRRIAEALLGNADPETAFASASGRRPETLTLAVALALQAEARDDIPRALEYYRTALDTGQTDWIEFRLAFLRCQALGRMQ